jgi:hypothetical protein
MTCILATAIGAQVTQAQTGMLEEIIVTVEKRVSTRTSSMRATIMTLRWCPSPGCPDGASECNGYLCLVRRLV